MPTFLSRVDQVGFVLAELACLGYCGADAVMSILELPVEMFLQNAIVLYLRMLYIPPVFCVIIWARSSTSASLPPKK